MPTTDRIDELLLQWEEARERGQPVTSEALCRDFPELLPVVSEKIRMLEAIYGIPTGFGDDTRGQPLMGPWGEPHPAPVGGYALLQVVGRGGMGVVYQARHLELDRLVALKMILSDTHAGPLDRARFRTEAEAVARLDHPNIVRIHEVGEQAGRPYLVLEWIDGGTLAQHLNGSSLPSRAAAALLLPVAEAVAYAHARGVVHRDLKPANILLRSQCDGEASGDSPPALVPKIADFGLAKRLDVEQGYTHTGDVLGTPNYMAPEQAAGRTQDVGPLTDVYALGAILYEMLTGRPPSRPTR
jgi:serine/threonine protein kinase